MFQRRLTEVRRTIHHKMESFDYDDWITEVYESSSPGLWVIITQNPDSRLSSRSRDLAHVFCPFGKVGDLLYVREPWTVFGYVTPPVPGPDATFIHYKASWGQNGGERLLQRQGRLPSASLTWKSGATMPKWVARTWLEITGMGAEKPSGRPWEWIPRFRVSSTSGKRG